MIKFINKQMGFDEQTFQPTVRITLDITIESPQDLLAKYGHDNVETILGYEFTKMLKECS